MITDRRSPAPPACCQSLRKHHVVWYCLGIVVAGFRSMAWLRCWFRCDIAAGMLFSAFALQWIVLSRLGVTLLSFALVSWCIVCFRVSPLRSSDSLQLGCVCRPDFRNHPLKNNNSVYKNRMNPLFALGENFDFMTPADSVRRLEMQNFGFTTILCQVWCLYLRSLAGVGRGRYICWNPIWMGNYFFSPECDRYSSKSRS